MSTYTLPVIDTLKSAWAKVHGAKQAIWTALLIIFAIVFCLSIIQGIAETMNTGLYQGVKFLTRVISYFLQLGVIYIGICRAKDLPIHYQLLWRPFNTQRALRIIGLYIIEFFLFLLPILIAIGSTALYTLGFPGAAVISGIIFALACLAMIYLTLRLIPSMAIILDQDLGPIDTVKQSFKLTQGNAISLVLISILQILILAVSAIPFGIGLIWTLPFALINYGVIYQSLLKNQSH